MLEVNCWPDLLIKSTVEPKRCLILDVRKSSLVEDRRVPENRNEFPFPLPSCLYGAIVVVPPTRVQFNCARKPLVTQALSLSNVKTGGLILHSQKISLEPITTTHPYNKPESLIKGMS